MNRKRFGLDLHECAWRIADGEFFKLDADFMGVRLRHNMGADFGGRAGRCANGQPAGDATETGKSGRRVFMGRAPGLELQRQTRGEADLENANGKSGQLCQSGTIKSYAKCLKNHDPDK